MNLCSSSDIESMCSISELKRSVYSFTLPKTIKWKAVIVRRPLWSLPRQWLCSPIPRRLQRILSESLREPPGRKCKHRNSLLLLRAVLTSQVARVHPIPLLFAFRALQFLEHGRVGSVRPFTAGLGFAAPSDNARKEVFSSLDMDGGFRPRTPCVASRSHRS
jgi:hypothetical protein